MGFYCIVRIFKYVLVTTKCLRRHLSLLGALYLVNHGMLVIQSNKEVGLQTRHSGLTPAAVQLGQSAEMRTHQLGFAGDSFPWVVQGSPGPPDSQVTECACVLGSDTEKYFKYFYL